MYSSYQREATFHADMSLSIHDRINDLCRRAERLAPCVYESAMVSGCTDTRPSDGHPRSQKAWDMVAESHGWNAISDRPDMLALAEEMHVNRKPFYVGYEPERDYTTGVLVDWSGVFGFGIWVPEDAAEDGSAPVWGKTCKHGGCVLTGKHTHGQSTEPANWEDALVQNATVTQEYVPALGRSFPADPPLQVTDAEPARRTCSCGEAWADEPGHDDAPLCGYPIPPCEMPNEHARRRCPCYGMREPLPAGELTECENCGAPCDGSCTAQSELTGEDLPICVACVPLLTLVADEPAQMTWDGDVPEIAGMALRSFSATTARAVNGTWFARSADGWRVTATPAVAGAHNSDRCAVCHRNDHRPGVWQGHAFTYATPETPVRYGDRVRNKWTGAEGTVKAVSDRRAGVQYDNRTEIYADDLSDLIRVTSQSVTETAMPAVGEVKNDLDSATLRNIRHVSARWYAIGRLDAANGHPACSESATDFADQYVSAAEALWAGQRSFLPSMHGAYEAWTRGETL